MGDRKHEQHQSLKQYCVVLEFHLDKKFRGSFVYVLLLSMEQSGCRVRVEEDSLRFALQPPCNLGWRP